MQDKFICYEILGFWVFHNGFVGLGICQKAPKQKTREIWTIRGRTDFTNYQIPMILWFGVKSKHQKRPSNISMLSPVPPEHTFYLYFNRRWGGESKREIVSFRFVRECVRAVWLPGGIWSQKFFVALPFSLLERRTFPFPFAPPPYTSYPSLVRWLYRYILQSYFPNPRRRFSTTLGCLLSFWFRWSMMMVMMIIIDDQWWIIDNGTHLLFY